MSALARRAAPTFAAAASWVERLPRIAAPFGDLFKEADRGFLEIGDRLGGAVDIFRNLTADFEALPRQLDSAELREAGRSLRSVAAQVTEMLAGLAEEREVLLRLIGLNRQVGARLAGLDKTVRSIAMLAVNAQIAAAGLSQKGEDFTTFTHEIARLTATASRAIEGYYKDYNQLAQLLSSAAATLGDFQGHHQGLLQSAARELESSVTAVEARRLQAAGAAAEISRRSTEIGREIGVVVMALQISDSTRQRAEHVDTVLQAVASEVPGGGLLDGGQSGDAELQSLGQPLCRLQVAQLKGTADDFDSEVSRIRGALGRLAADARKAVALGDDLSGARDRRGTSFMQDLEQKLRVTDGLLQKCLAARAGVDRVVTAAVTVLRQLLQHLASVRDIEADMRLVGLNTTFKCGRLGNEGRALSVIAQELRGYANQIVGDAAMLTETLKAIVAAAEGFEGAGLSRSSERNEGLKQRMAAALEQFQAAAGHVGTALDTLARNGNQVGSTLQNAADTLARQDGVAKVLRRAAGELAATADNLVARAQDETMARQRIAAMTRGLYTMAQEREIHAAVLGGGEATLNAAATAPPASVESLVDDILF